MSKPSQSKNNSGTVRPITEGGDKGVQTHTLEKEYSSKSERNNMTGVRIFLLWCHNPAC